ncbi:serine hydrolase [Hyphomonas sp.]|jgi:CubicO group peptidase (beta-lactamase class C family)|uniref:serine hydrolase domain-containing protein n=1 Tax=Hyphomonas sp. TaxID=87 RepID=UPI0032D93549
MWRKIFISGLAAIVTVGAAAAQSLVPLPPQPEGLAWPTQGWETGEIPGEAAALVQPLIDQAMAGKPEDKMGETRALVIVHQGKIVVEAYADGFGPDTKQVSWSMAKSVTSALAGRAVELGLITDLDAPMPTPFDEGDPRAEISWRQWLTMTDGLDYTEIGATSMAENDVIQMMYGSGRMDVLEYIKDELPPLHEPGTVWNYSTAAFHLIGHALQGLAASDSSSPAFSDWFRRQFSDQIGMNAVIEFDPAGTYLGGSLVWASARDFAKFGYLYLRDGVWEGERLLPEGWVDFSRSHPEAPKENVYGAGFWLTTDGAAPVPDYQRRDAPPWDSFAAEGHEGQTIFIVPSRDLVIVRLGLMSNEGENWPLLFRWNQAIASAFPVVEPGEILIP